MPHIKTRITLICAKCEKPFLRQLSQISRTFNCCSRKCAKIIQKNKGIVYCITCKNPLIRNLSQRKMHKIFYCDQECRKKHINIFGPRERKLHRRENCILWHNFGTTDVSMATKKMMALGQVQRKGFKKSIIDQIRKGETYEAYI